jgi:hypothetical protein
MSIQINHLNVQNTSIRPKAKYIIDDDFNTYVSGTTWTTKRGTPTVGSWYGAQAINLQAGGRVAIQSVADLPTDFELTTSVRSNNSFTFFWKMANVTTWDGYNSPWFTTGRYLVNDYTMHLNERISGADSSRVDTGAHDFSSWNTIVIRDVANTVTILLNGTQIAQYTMSSSSIGGNKLYIQNREISDTFVMMDYLKVKEL